MRRVYQWLISICYRVFHQGELCCNCNRFDKSRWLCKVAIIYKGCPSYTRTRPWFDCLLQDIKDQINFVDLNIIHEQVESALEKEADAERTDDVQDQSKG